MYYRKTVTHNKFMHISKQHSSRLQQSTYMFESKIHLYKDNYCLLHLSVVKILHHSLMIREKYLTMGKFGV